MASAALHYAAFTTTPAGGNPAGVVLDATGMSDADMLALAARLAYSESAFLWPRDEDGHYDVRYFSPEAEVPFCGHATIASGVALAEHTGATGRLVLHTASGEVAGGHRDRRGRPDGGHADQRRAVRGGARTRHC